MPATPESRARTRAFARVIGPFLSIIAASVAVRMPSIGPLVASFFDSPMLVWMTGAMLLLGGVFIIANHQYWSGLSAIVISLFGWFLALRGVVQAMIEKLQEVARLLGDNDESRLRQFLMDAKTQRDRLRK